MFRIDRLYTGEVHVCVHEDVKGGWPERETGTGTGKPGK